MDFNRQKGSNSPCGINNTIAQSTLGCPTKKGAAILLKKPWPPFTQVQGKYVCIASKFFIQTVACLLFMLQFLILVTGIDKECWEGELTEKEKIGKRQQGKKEKTANKKEYFFLKQVVI